MVFLPVVVTSAGIFRHVYIDPVTLAVTPFEREVAGATAFNGIGVVCAPDVGLPASLASASFPHKLEEMAQLVSRYPGNTLRLVPFD